MAQKKATIIKVSDDKVSIGMEDGTFFDVSRKELDFWECHLILSRDTKRPNGYNLTDGGNGFSGFKHSPEHNAKISAALTGKSRPAEFVVKFSMIRRFYSPYKNLSGEIETHKLTYLDLHKRLGLANVSEKMRGLYNFTAKDIAKLVEIFGKPAEYLMAREG